MEHTETHTCSHSPLELAVALQKFHSKWERTILYHQCSVKFYYYVIEERFTFRSTYANITCNGKNIKSGRTYTPHQHTQVLVGRERRRRKIISKRKIVAKVLLTWSKMHYHNGNSCFGFGQTVPFLYALCLRRRSCSSLRSAFSPFGSSFFYITRNSTAIYEHHSANYNSLSVRSFLHTSFTSLFFECFRLQRMVL